MTIPAILTSDVQISILYYSIISLVDVLYMFHVTPFLYTDITVYMLYLLMSMKHYGHKDYLMMFKKGMYLYMYIMTLEYYWTAIKLVCSVYIVLEFTKWHHLVILLLCYTCYNVYRDLLAQFWKIAKWNNSQNLSHSHHAHMPTILICTHEIFWLHVLSYVSYSQTTNTPSSLIKEEVKQANELVEKIREPTEPKR